MMRKKETYINITPIPSSVPRQLALDILHSHGEIITLNPLVLSYQPIKAPRDAAADEYYSTWYEITERLQYIPGIGKMGSSKISFKGSFHDVPWGLITHMYAPMGVDLKSKWSVGGNQPDNPAELREPELHLDVAEEGGLYLREDIEIECNFTLMSFVKSQLKAASKVLVERLIKKAELLDAGVLQATIEDGKLKTINPADRTSTVLFQPPLSPGLQPDQRSSILSWQGPRSPTLPTDPTRLGSMSSMTPPQLDYSFPPPQYGQEHSGSMAVELPADCYHPQPLFASEKYKRVSDPDSSRYLESGSLSGSRPNSGISSNRGSRQFQLDKTYPAELPAMKESSEEHSQTQNVVRGNF